MTLADSDTRCLGCGKVWLLTPLSLEAIMLVIADRPDTPAAIRTDIGAIFVSLELA
jgi:hypothetical protein